MSTFNELIKEIIKERLDLLNKLSEKEIIVPTFEQIVQINKNIMELHGGIFGLRDKNLLHSAIDSVFNHINYAQEKNPLRLSFLLFQKIIQTHPFTDGNKRTAVITCELMLKLNGVPVEVSNDFYYQISYEIAQGKIQNYEELKKTILKIENKTKSSKPETLSLLNKLKRLP